MKESQIQKAITDWLTAKNIFWKRMALGPMMHGGGKAKLRMVANPMKGFPDLMGFLPLTSRGELFAIEIKSENGRLSPEQKQWREDLERHGAFYIEARSLDDVIDAFARRFG